MPTFAELFGPNPDYPYFALAGDHPFDAGGRKYSAVNASWLADAALLAYLPTEDAVRERLARAGLDGTCMGFGEPGTQCFVARGGGWAMVSFRGTEVDDLADVRDDVRFVMKAHEPYPGRVHTGFAEALERVWPRVESELADLSEGPSAAPVWFTGHSLGAALATLAASRYPARGVYTFGSPRVGDQAFCTGLDVPAWRFVNNNDLVVGLPPGPPVGRYRHVGVQKFLDHEGRLLDEPPVRTRLAAQAKGHGRAAQDTLRDVLRGKLTEVNYARLRDHSPTAYAVHLRAALAAGGAGPGPG